MTLDSWEQIYVPAMIGCNNYGYPFTDRSFHNRQTQCKQPNALGWVGYILLLPVTVVVAYIIPTLLIGVVAVKFEDTMSRLLNKQIAKRNMDNTILRLKVIGCWLGIS